MKREEFWQILNRQVSCLDVDKLGSEETWQKEFHALAAEKGQEFFDQIVVYLQGCQAIYSKDEARWRLFLARALLLINGLPFEYKELAVERYFTAGLYLGGKVNKSDEVNFFALLGKTRNLLLENKIEEMKSVLSELERKFPQMQSIIEIGKNMGFFSTHALKKIAFFVKPGMDSFLGDIINSLQDDYIVKKYVVTEVGQIDKGMAWADICWFEWCDELIIYGSQSELASQKIMICRLHRYEAFSKYPKMVSWNEVDKVVFVSEHIQDVFLKKVKIEQDKCCVIYNGINMDKFQYQKREKGYNLAWIGYLNLRKNPMLLLQFFNELVKADSRYQLHFAGDFQEEILFYYLNDMVKRLNLENNIHFYGHIPNERISEWLRDKHYIVSSSIAEGHPVGIMEAMTSGLKPAIHYFPGAEEYYEKEYIYYDLDGFKKIFLEETYESKEYSKFIQDKFSFVQQMTLIKNILIKVIKKKQIILKKEIFNSDVSDEKSKFAFEKVLERLKNPIMLSQVNDLTVLIPTYNRTEILLEDLEKGLKLGAVPKLIVDDCSQELHLKKLNAIKGKFGVDKVFMHTHNQGLAITMKTGMNMVETSKLISLDDDDMLLCLNEEKFKDDIDDIAKQEILMVIPRYIINVDGNGNFSMGYDRIQFNNSTGYEMLKFISMTGELLALNAGACYKINLVRNTCAEKIFRVGDDFVRLARLFAENPGRKIKLSENYIYIRRISLSSLSRKMNNEKISIHLYSLLVAWYYMLQLKIATVEEMIGVIKKRGELLQKIYGYGNDIADAVLCYLSGDLKKNELYKIIGAEKGCQLPTEPELLRRFISREKSVELNFYLENKPLVSIIILSYNRKGYLQQAISSALSQDYENFEVIVSDDASVDGTELVMEKYRHDQRLKFHQHEENVGVIANAHYALYELASGEYAMFLDHDDYLTDTHHISAAIQFFLSHKNVSFVFSNCEILDEVTGKKTATDHKMQKITKGKDYFLHYEMPGYCHVVSGLGVVFNRLMAIEMQTHTEQTYALDLFLWQKLMLCGDVGFLDSTCGVYRVHQGSLSNKLDEKYDLTTIRELEKLFEVALQKGIPREEAKQWLLYRVFKYVRWAMSMHCSNGRYDIAKSIVESIKDQYSQIYEQLLVSL